VPWIHSRCLNSREAEDQADAQGLALLQEAGINPKGMMSFLISSAKNKKAHRPFGISPLILPTPNDGIISKTWHLLTQFPIRNSPFTKTGKSPLTSAKRSLRKASKQ